MPLLVLPLDLPMIPLVLPLLPLVAGVPSIDTCDICDSQVELQDAT